MSFGPQPSSHHAAAQRRQNAERLALRPELNIGILSANNAGSAAKASRCTGRAAWSSAAAPAELSGSPVHVGARVPRPSSSPSQLPSKPKASRAVFPRPSSGRLPDLPPCATETFVWRDLELVDLRLGMLQRPLADAGGRLPEFDRMVVARRREEDL